MDKEAKVETLRGRGTLSDFTDPELRSLVEASDSQILHSGDPLWTIGDPRTHVFVLLSGAIERTTKTYLGRKTTQLDKPGAILSISSLVGSWEYYSTAYAVERTEVLTLSREKFEELFDAGDPVSYRLVDAIGEYLVSDMRDANERLQEVFGHPADTLRMLRRRIREDSKA